MVLWYNLSMRCLIIFSVFAIALCTSVAYAQTFTISPAIIETSPYAIASFSATRTDDEVIDTMSIGRCSYNISSSTSQNFILGIIVSEGAMDGVPYDYPVCITDGATGAQVCSILRYNPDAPSVGIHSSDIGMYLFTDCRNTDRQYLPLLTVSSQ